MRWNDYGHDVGEVVRSDFLPILATDGAGEGEVAYRASRGRTVVVVSPGAFRADERCPWVEATHSQTTATTVISAAPTRTMCAILSVQFHASSRAPSFRGGQYARRRPYLSSGRLLGAVEWTSGWRTSAAEPMPTLQRQSADPRRAPRRDR